jgi:hydrogenase expression/formation protein HypE
MFVRDLPLGKVDWAIVDRLLRQHRLHHSEVLVGPGLGEDAAAIDLGERCLVAASDPVTFASDAIGYYAVQVNANDLATMGAAPRWFLATILLPEMNTTEASVSQLFAQLGLACRQMDVDLIGGHTEVTAGLARPIVVGTMLGLVASDRLVTSSGAQPGDAVILTKGVAVEGTALIAREKHDDLKTKYDKAFLERCKDMLYDPGISVLKEARVAGETVRAHAMHDPTEGGLATGLWELADASQVGLVIQRDRMPILPETSQLCREYGLNPLGLIASGALLIAVRPEDASVLLQALRSEGIDAATIAEVVESDGVRWRDGSLVPRFDRDEVTRLFQKE